jgi:glycine cleavage system H protein
MTPSDRRYTETHEWIKIEDGLAVVGITDYAQEALGDITFVDLPDAEQDIEQDQEIAVIESVKAASDIYAPLGGSIAEVNEALDSNPETVNEDPYGEGWLFKIENFDMDQFNDLLDAADYEAMNEEEESDA